MDEADNTFHPEETIQIQRIESYLQDLNGRLMELSQRQEDITRISMHIIQEINRFFSMTISDQKINDGLENHTTNIKKLIRNFESTSKESEMLVILNQQHLDMRYILQKFEKLYKSDDFEQSLILFSKIKESFGKIENFYEKLKNMKYQNSDMKKCYISKAIREKIDNLNRKQTESNHPTSGESETLCNFNVAVQTETVSSESIFENDSSSYYQSCYSSTSLQKQKSNNDSKSSISYVGYEGDIDGSELDLHYSNRHTTDQDVLNTPCNR